jgi:hypothetical protein
MEAVGAAMGIIGLINQKKAQDDQNKLIKKGMKADEAIKGLQFEGLTELQNLARKYDPARETELAVQDAAKVTGDTLEKSLKNLVAEYSKFGGVPGLSSEWNVKTQGLTDRVTDPLRRFAAERKTGDTQRKMAAWTTATTAAPGNFGDSYFKAASMSNVPSPMGSLQGILQGLMKFGGGGGGGSGDFRGGSATVSNNVPGWALQQMGLAG